LLPAPQKWQVKVKDELGDNKAILTGQEDGFIGFSFSTRVNCPGSFLIYFIKRADETESRFLDRVAPFQLDRRVEFRRDWLAEEIEDQLMFTGLMRDEKYYTTVDGGLLYTASGRGFLDFLHRRIIEAYPSTPESDKSGLAEAVAKSYVEENAATGARAIPGLTVQADGGFGNQVTFKKAHRNLLETVQEIVKVGGGDIDVVSTGPATYEFRWYDGQRGTDRRDSVDFSLDLGNMGQPTMEIKHHDEITAVLVGGQGQGPDRELIWRTSDRIDSSIYNRIEKWRDARQEDETEGLEILGDEWLDLGKPKHTLDFVPLQTPGCLLGKRYFFGDLVTAHYMGFTRVKKIVGYTFTWNQDNQDTKVVTEDAE